MLSLLYNVCLEKGSDQPIAYIDRQGYTGRFSIPYRNAVFECTR